MGEWSYNSIILNLGTRTDWSASRTRHFTPWDAASDTHCIGYVGPRAGMDVMEKKKYFAATGNGTGTFSIYIIGL
jgi:hypothetical protein